jgi:CRP/FNR family transcriptional regulator
MASPKQLNKGRLVCALLELASDFAQDIGSGRTVIRQKIGQSDLAAMAGIGRESTSRIINDWHRRNDWSILDA